jgi:hypothetical protein
MPYITIGGSESCTRSENFDMGKPIVEDLGRLGKESQCHHGAKLWRNGGTYRDAAFSLDLTWPAGRSTDAEEAIGM